MPPIGGRRICNWSKKSSASATQRASARPAASRLREFSICPRVVSQGDLHEQSACPYGRECRVGYAAERSDAELDSTMAYHEQGTAGSLHLTEYNYLPDAKFDLHAHDQAEIIYVLAGTLLFGARELGRGSSVFIAEHTLYEFAAGPQGLRMLVFMADGRVKYFGKDDFLRQQAAKKIVLAEIFHASV